MDVDVDVEVKTLQHRRENAYITCSKGSLLRKLIVYLMSFGSRQRPQFKVASVSFPSSRFVLRDIYTGYHAIVDGKVDIYWHN